MIRDERIQQRIRAEYREMPALRLTLEKGVRDMRLPFVLPITVLLAFTMASCQQATPPESAVTATSAPASTPSADTEAMITRLEREWVTAIVKKDATALSRLLADDFVGTTPTAHLYTKKTAIDDIASGTYVVEAMDLDDISVNAYGDVAVAFASQQEKSQYAGKETGGHYHYTNVWVKRDGAWQAVASHGSRFATGH